MKKLNIYDVIAPAIVLTAIIAIVYLFITRDGETFINTINLR